MRADLMRHKPGPCLIILTAVQHHDLLRLQGDGQDAHARSMSFYQFRVSGPVTHLVAERDKAIVQLAGATHSLQLACWESAITGIRRVVFAWCSAKKGYITTPWVHN